MCWHSSRQLGLHKAVFFSLIDSGGILTLSIKVACIILKTEVIEFSLTWSGGNIKNLILLRNLINLCSQNSSQKLHWKVFGKAKEASKMLLLTIYCMAFTHSDCWQVLWKFSIHKNYTIVCKTDPGLPNILQFLAGEQLKMTICMVFWDVRLGSQHHHMVFANAETEARMLCALERDVRPSGEFYSTPRIIFKNNLPVFNQKTFKDSFNFHLMFSSCLLFSLRWTWSWS